MGGKGREGGGGEGEKGKGGGGREGEFLKGGGEGRRIEGGGVLPIALFFLFLCSFFFNFRCEDVSADFHTCY